MLKFMWTFFCSQQYMQVQLKIVCLFPQGTRPPYLTGLRSRSLFIAHYLLPIMTHFNDLQTSKPKVELLFPAYYITGLKFLLAIELLIIARFTLCMRYAESAYLL